MKQSRYPTEVCKLILANVKEYEQVKTENLQNKDRGGFELRRFKMDIKQISKLAQGVPITPAYLKVLKLEMSMNGWIVSEGITAELLFIKADSLNNYTRLSIKPRVEGSHYDKLLSGDISISELDNQVMGLKDWIVELPEGMTEKRPDVIKGKCFHVEDLPERFKENFGFVGIPENARGGRGWIAFNKEDAIVGFGIGTYQDSHAVGNNKPSPLDRVTYYDHGEIVEKGIDGRTIYACNWSFGEK